MGVKQDLYTEFLRNEGYVPESDANGDIRFKIQGEIYVIAVAEDDPNYFKISYYHAWDQNNTEKAWAILNAINARFKVVKVSALENVVCLTTETFLKEPDDFKSVFARCVNMIGVGKAQLAAALTQAAQPARAEQ